MTPDLKAAAERLRKHNEPKRVENSPYQRNGAACDVVRMRLDIELLADAWLAEHPADDEPTAGGAPAGGESDLEFIAQRHRALSDPRGDAMPFTRDEHLQASAAIHQMLMERNALAEKLRQLITAIDCGDTFEDALAILPDYVHAHSKLAEIDKTEAKLREAEAQAAAMVESIYKSACLYVTETGEPGPLSDSWGWRTIADKLRKAIPPSTAGRDLLARLQAAEQKAALLEKLCLEQVEGLRGAMNKVFAMLEEASAGCITCCAYGREVAKAIRATLTGAPSCGELTTPAEPTAGGAPAGDLASRARLAAERIALLIYPKTDGWQNYEPAIILIIGIIEEELRRA